jgi:hypothetical protein
VVEVREGSGRTGRRGAVNRVREAALNEPDPGFGARLYALTEAQSAVVRAYLNTRPPARLRT